MLPHSEDGARGRSLPMRAVLRRAEKMGRMTCRDFFRYAYLCVFRGCIVVTFFSYFLFLVLSCARLYK